jgi:hypothetical protein
MRRGCLAAPDDGWGYFSCGATAGLRILRRGLSRTCRLCKGEKLCSSVPRLSSNLASVGARGGGRGSCVSTAARSGEGLTPTRTRGEESEGRRAYDPHKPALEPVAAGSPATAGRLPRSDLLLTEAVVRSAWCPWRALRRLTVGPWLTLTRACAAPQASGGRRPCPG